MVIACRYGRQCVVRLAFNKDDSWRAFPFDLALHSRAVVGKLQVGDGDAHWVVGNAFH